MSFQRAVAWILAEEGGLVDDPHDHGGLTKYGIALKSHPELTAAAIRALTPEQAAGIYRSEYWAPLHGEELPERWGLPLLDAAVLQGVHVAVECAQDALYLPANGIMGPQTLRALASATRADALARFTAGRLARLESLPDFLRYGRGWTTRAIQAALEAS